MRLWKARFVSRCPRAATRRDAGASPRSGPPLVRAIDFSAAGAMSSAALTGARPYRFLDETSVGNGYVRLRALALLPVILVVLFAVVLGFETGGYGAEEDRDNRDMA